MQAESRWRNMWRYIREKSLADEQQHDIAYFLLHTKTCQRALAQLVLTTPATCRVTTYYKAFTVGCTGSLLASRSQPKFKWATVHASIAIQSVATHILTALSDHAVMQRFLLLAAPGRLERIAWPQKHASKSKWCQARAQFPQEHNQIMSMRL